MSQPVRESALRRMVADLAAMHGEDIVAVLRELEPDRRQAVEALLQEYAGGSAISTAYDPTRLSPWMCGLLDVSPGNMTADTLEALKQCAVQLYPLVSDANRVSKPLGRAIWGQSR